MTLSEKTLWEKLRRNSFNLRFRRQHPINNYIADFYCHEIRLVIEVDGPIHLKEENNQNDKNRTAEMEKYGITVLRFTNDEVLFKINEVLEKIQIKVDFLLLNQS
jgi:very-short-patch-repair endonuclease